MKKMSVDVAEKIYKILIKYANVNPSYFEKEHFIFHFCVYKDFKNEYELNCLDNEKRILYFIDDKIFLIGKDSEKVNSIFKHIHLCFKK